MKAIQALWSLPVDFVGHLRSEAHQSRPATYSVVRRAYALSGGRSRRAFKRFFGAIRPFQQSDSEVLRSLRQDGVVLVPGYLVDHAKIKAFLDKQPTEEINSVRRNYDSAALLECSEIRALINDPYIVSLAGSYLGSQPVFAGINAWQSIADPTADDGDLDAAAQLFHYDYDWPAFVKFFFYLTDVRPENGPFTYVAGTHEAKVDYTDGRRHDAYIERTYRGQVREMIGTAGDMIVADTVGFHKGQRVRRGSRVMLQLEFAVSRIGASFQYDLMPKAHRPSAGRTWDLFAK